MPHRRSPTRLVPYLAYLAAGILLTIYQPPSLQALAASPLVVVWHVVLLAGAALALAGAATQREVPEMTGLVLICGPVLAYAIILGLLAAGDDDQGRWATWGIACLILAGATFAAGRAAMLWSLVREARRAGRS